MLTDKHGIDRVTKFTLDHLHSAIGEKFTRLHDTDAKFGFLLDINKLCYGDGKNSFHFISFDFISNSNVKVKKLLGPKAKG